MTLHNVALSHFIWRHVPPRTRRNFTAWVLECHAGSSLADLVDDLNAHYAARA